MSMHTIRCVCVGEGVCVWMGGWLQHITALQHTASHCKSLEHTLQLYNTLQHCTTLQYTATHCNTHHAVEHTATNCSTLQHTLQHTTCLFACAATRAMVLAIGAADIRIELPACSPLPLGGLAACLDL